MIPEELVFLQSERVGKEGRMILDTETGIVTTTAKDGTVSKRPLTDVERAEVLSLAKKQAGQQKEASEASPARARLARRRAEAGERPQAERLEVAGETWFCRVFDAPCHNMVAALTPRDKDGEMALTADNLRAFQSAVTFVGCVMGLDDLEPYFQEYSEAWDIVTDTTDAGIEVANALFSKIREMNPSLLVQEEDAREQEKKDAGKSASASANEPATESTTETESADTSSPPLTPGESSSTSTDSSATPAESLPDSESLTSTGVETFPPLDV